MKNSRSDRERDRFRDAANDLSKVAVTQDAGDIFDIEIVKTVKESILDAEDRIQLFTYTTIGTKERLDEIKYTAVSVPGYELYKYFVWLDFGTKNERIQTITWSLIGV